MLGVSVATMSARAFTGVLLAAATLPPHASFANTSALVAQNFPGRILTAHNAVRASAGRAPVVWDRQLGTEAASYATQMAITGLFQHSDGHARPGTGENLWMGTRGAFSIESMVGAWASEKRMFFAGVFPAVSRTGNWADVGHYTQIVWPTTERIGCALASNGKTDYLVCRYSPGGNVHGTRI